MSAGRPCLVDCEKLRRPNAKMEKNRAPLDRSEAAGAKQQRARRIDHCKYLFAVSRREFRWKLILSIDGHNNPNPPFCVCTIDNNRTRINMHNINLFIYFFFFRILLVFDH